MTHKHCISDWKMTYPQIELCTLQTYKHCIPSYLTNWPPKWPLYAPNTQTLYSWFDKWLTPKLSSVQSKHTDTVFLAVKTTIFSIELRKSWHHKHCLPSWSNNLPHKMNSVLPNPTDTVFLSTKIMIAQEAVMEIEPSLRPNKSNQQLVKSQL